MKDDGRIRGAAGFVRCTLRRVGPGTSGSPGANRKRSESRLENVTADTRNVQMMKMWSNDTVIEKMTCRKVWRAPNMTGVSEILPVQKMPMIQIPSPKSGP